MIRGEMKNPHLNVDKIVKKNKCGVISSNFGMLVGPRTFHYRLKKKYKDQETNEKLSEKAIKKTCS